MLRRNFKERKLSKYSRGEKPVSRINSRFSKRLSVKSSFRNRKMIKAAESEALTKLNLAIDNYIKQYGNKWELYYDNRDLDNVADHLSRGRVETREELDSEIINGYMGAWDDALDDIWHTIQEFGILSESDIEELEYSAELFETIQDRIEIVYPNFGEAVIPVDVRLNAEVDTSWDDSPLITNDDDNFIGFSDYVKTNIIEGIFNYSATKATEEAKQGKGFGYDLYDAIANTMGYYCILNIVGNITIDDFFKIKEGDYSFLKIPVGANCLFVDNVNGAGGINFESPKSLVLDKKVVLEVLPNKSYHYNIAEIYDPGSSFWDADITIS